MIRAVLDSNIIISGFYNPQSPPGKIISLAIQGDILLFTSNRLLEELAKILRYSRIQKMLKKAGVAQEEIMSDYQEFCFVVTGNPLNEQVCRDPDDDWVLACAVQAQADWIVTGDKDLLSLEEYNFIRILSAADFLKKFE